MLGRFDFNHMKGLFLTPGVGQCAESIRDFRKNESLYSDDNLILLFASGQDAETSNLTLAKWVVLIMTCACET
jgi:hypothetical protein